MSMEYMTQDRPGFKGEGKWTPLLGVGSRVEGWGELLADKPPQRNSVASF